MAGAGLFDFTNQSGGILGSLFNIPQARHLADAARGEGDPYRSQLRAIQQDPNLYFQGPIAQGLARQADMRYSSIFGNPAGSGTAQALSLEAMLQGYDRERALLGKLGGVDYYNQNIFPSRTAQNKAYTQPFQDVGNMAGAGMNTQDVMGLVGGGLGGMLG